LQNRGYAKIAEITIPRTGGHIRKLFGILSAYPDGLQAAGALAKLAASVEMTSYEAEIYESTGTRRFEKINRFATVDCSKAGWLLKNKGVWSVAEAGKKAMIAYPDPD
jgi:restriction system protein